MLALAFLLLLGLLLLLRRPLGLPGVLLGFFFQIAYGNNCRRCIPRLSTAFAHSAAQNRHPSPMHSSSFQKAPPTLPPATIPLISSLPPAKSLHHYTNQNLFFFCFNSYFPPFETEVDLAINTRTWNRTLGRPSSSFRLRNHQIGRAHV